jgi:hypothetical protein
MGDGRRMRSMSVAIGVTAVAAAALSGCTATPDYEAVCIDDLTYERVNDDNCDDDEYSNGGYRWYYYGGGTRLPSVGSHVSGGSTTKPRRGSSSGGSYSDPGSSSHDYGGFGGRSGGVSS